MKRIRKYIIAALVATTIFSAQAQQVTTLFFLENAPMRHVINPALQPVSSGYINFTPLGYMSFWDGNNSLTMRDLIYTDQSGKTITALHPEGGDRAKLLSTFRNSTLINGDMTIGLLNMGFRIKDDGYLMIGINERVDLGVSMPKTMFDFILGGGMTDLDGGINYFNLSRLGAYANVYTEVSGGYSHRINEHWTVGGKLKLLLGQAHMGLRTTNLGIDANTEKWLLHGDVNMYMSAPCNWDVLPQMEGKSLGKIIDEFSGNNQNTNSQLQSVEWNKLFDTKNIGKLLTPVGYGAAVDVGFTYKPIEQVQISAALVDLGFIYWTNARSLGGSVKATYDGVGEIQYSDYVDENNQFMGDKLKDDIVDKLKTLVDSVQIGSVSQKGFVRMPSAKLNVGVDANFWDNRVGIGVLSQTRMYDCKFYEEVTIGAAFRPVNWFNLAVSYSLLENGKYSNIGAGLGFMPYDGINMTLAMDYIPTSYAGMDINGQKRYVLPYKSKGFNMALGFSICWGSNKRDKDKDGVWDKLDMCPNTPLGVAVDEQGCPLDEDKDGVPDYLDKCLGTPAAALGTIDSVGCPIDSDGDGVPDYIDRCPNTPKEAIGTTDSVGCPIDSDGDGVADYLDRCPNTPKEAIGHVDAQGCPLDSDKDGIPDYLDRCPGTPEGASVNENGCELDSDGDGVPDWRDECPRTRKEAIGHVDAKGCDLDSDHDGVPDWQDECPHTPGIKENKGCPEVKREIRQLLKKAMQGIEFETARATIRPSSYSLLDEIAQQFIENPSFIIEVQGHTDNTGKADKNMTLSQDRANAVRDYLIGKGVPAERMTARGYGQDKPIADNSTKAGRAKNRRVEFDITFEEVTVETILDHADPTPTE
ncbi:MAG: OmpA family protein [Paludibacteraceae bacterium]|nr:OmpA family protein [Paludibacteraceae bacterium]